ncbi:MAG: Crp/Fnr family transcriptional regulator [Cyclobacteriaceae bacterium]
MTNYKHLFDDNFGRYTNISKEAYDYLLRVFQVRELKQREFLTEAGSVERYFYFVISGVQAMYVISNKGEKVVLGFSYDGSPSGVYDSFIHETPSNYFMEALTPSKLIAINKQHYNELFERFPEFKDWRINFMETILFGRAKREVEMVTLTAKERFDAFTARCPQQLLTIPQKYIASYLNMTPETFSRMRAKM